MKIITRNILFFLLIIFSSCSSIYRFSIDVQEPAMITLPVSAQNVLILNNSLAQPLDNGIERDLNGKSIPADYPLALDSMVWPAISEIANVLGESNFFNTVAIYKEPLRKDGEWLSPVYLSKEQQYNFFESDNFDALFVVERLLFYLKENVNINKLNESTPYIDIRADGVLNCSMYVYGKEKPLSTFVVFDSLFVKYITYNDSLFLFKEIPEGVLHNLSIMVGNQAAKCVVPTWQTVERVLFVSQGARMQEAAGYAANRRWKNAESIWITEFEKNTKPVNKAKIAFNIAVANEMQDKLEPALEWVLKAKDYFKNSNTDIENQIELADKYLTELGRRIQNNRMLDLQWGKDITGYDK